MNQALAECRDEVKNRYPTNTFAQIISSNPSLPLNSATIYTPPYLNLAYSQSSNLSWLIATPLIPSDNSQILCAPFIAALRTV
ncbi:hypothetical protein PGTUg99_012430 [Puccinia graminis f. sp. tritici]|uniref:Uncharacterized protein n=1 Tax=Puccinia graminis f. sp. tritici TaxID=56615 RepID=A0A5B0R941_PUCGR|nr:hypothetical protein PGTUg99_012430 [Puccinia graminis f. sp. tritici]